MAAAIRPAQTEIRVGDVGDRGVGLDPFVEVRKLPTPAFLGIAEDRSGLEAGILGAARPDGEIPLPRRILDPGALYAQRNPGKPQRILSRQFQYIELAEQSSSPVAAVALIERDLPADRRAMLS